MKRYQIDENGVTSPDFYNDLGAPVWPVWTCVIVFWIVVIAIGWRFF